MDPSFTSTPLSLYKIQDTRYRKDRGMIRHAERYLGQNLERSFREKSSLELGFFDVVWGGVVERVCGKERGGRAGGVGCCWGDVCGL